MPATQSAYYAAVWFSGVGLRMTSTNDIQIVYNSVVYTFTAGVPVDIPADAADFFIMRGVVEACAEPVPAIKPIKRK